jgi:type I restriction enzyme S subunit
LTESQREEGPIPVYGSRGIIGHHKESTVKGPGIVVGRKGTVGHVSWSESDFWPIDTTYYLVTKTELDMIWLFYSLIFSNLPKLNAATGVPGLNRNDAYALEIDFPPINEQIRIGEILENVDLTITQTEQLIEKLRAIKSGLLHDLLTRGIGEDGRVRDPEKQPEEFMESEFGLIPKTWSIMQISDLTEINGATLTGSADPEYEIEYIDISSIERLGEVSNTTTMKFNSAPSRARRIVRSGDTIVSTVRPYLRAFAFIESASKNLIASTGFAVLTPNDQVHPAFIFQIVCSESFVQHLTRRMTGSNYPAVVASDVGDYSFPLPTTHEQEQISEILLTLDSRIFSEERYCSKLSLLKKGLMSDLLTGRVRVRIPKIKNREG